MNFSVTFSFLIILDLVSFPAVNFDAKLVFFGILLGIRALLFLCLDLDSNLVNFFVFVFWAGSSEIIIDCCLVDSHSASFNLEHDNAPNLLDSAAYRIGLTQVLRNVVYLVRCIFDVAILILTVFSRYFVFLMAEPHDLVLCFHIFHWRLDSDGSLIFIILYIPVFWVVTDWVCNVVTDFDCCGLCFVGCFDCLEVSCYLTFSRLFID